VRFKTLVGFESVFPLEWEGDAMDIEGPQAYRSARIAEYVDVISVGNADEWYETIKVCAAVKSNDLAMFPSFIEFLRQLSAKKPDIMFGYIEKHEAFLRHLLPPYWRASRKAAGAPTRLR